MTLRRCPSRRRRLTLSRAADHVGLVPRAALCIGLLSGGNGREGRSAPAVGLERNR